MDRTTEKYLKRFALYPPLIEEPPSKNLNTIIVIPTHNEPDLIGTLEALWRCERPRKDVEVIVVINASKRSSPDVHLQNERTLREAQKWKEAHEDPILKWHLLFFPDLPPKRAGVGLARKIGMDEATRRFASIGNHQGIIANLDADCSCEPNYLVALENIFEQYPKMTGCSIYYEHPLEGSEPPEIYEAIVRYELFLRYYVHALRFSQFPHVYQTVGSSFAVRSDAYQKVGGMNQKQAGEDFYFLQKIFQTEACLELRTTKVIPSPRISDRVPFGTGKAISDIIKNPHLDYLSYNPSTFLDLRVFLSSIERYYSLELPELQEAILTLPKSIYTFLQNVHFLEEFERARKSTKSFASFKKRFFQWFNGFMALKWVHFARDNFYPDKPIEEGAAWLLQEYNFQLQDASNSRELLDIFRKIDRGELSVSF